MTEIYRAIFENIKNAVIVAEKEKIIDSNRALLDLLKKKDKSELPGDKQLMNLIEKCIANQRKSYEKVADKDGHEILLEISTSMIDQVSEVFLLELTPVEDQSLYKEITMLSSYNRELFINAPEAIVILNNIGLVVDVNRAFEKIFEYNRLEAIGRDIDDLVLKESDREAGKALFQRVLNNERVEINGQRITRSGRIVDVRVIGYPVLIDNHIKGNFVIYSDISGYIERGRQLKEKEEFLTQLFNKSLYPIAIIDKEEIILDVNTEFLRLFGYPKSDLLNKCINDFIIPDGYEKEAGLFLNKILNKETMMARTERKNKAGELIDVEAVGNPVIINNEVVGMFAMYRDIRKEEKALRELSLEKAYFKQLFDNSPDPIAILDEKDRIISFNKPFETMFGYRLDEVRGLFINDLIVSDGYKDESSQYTRDVVYGGKTLKVESIRTNSKGEEIEVEIIAFPVFLNENQFGAYAIYRDISERKTKELEINELVYRDSLTGIYNRKYAYESLAAKIDSADRENQSAAFLYFDLDGFKKVNDQKGHKTGDELLKLIAERINNHFGDKMEICRVGGDEFMAIISECSPANTSDYVEELKDIFYKKFKVRDEKYRVDLSIGYAVYPKDGEDVDQLISKADARMYPEKKINRIRRNPFRKTTTMEELIKELER